MLKHAGLKFGNLVLILHHVWSVEYMWNSHTALWTQLIVYLVHSHIEQDLTVRDM